MNGLSSLDQRLLRFVPLDKAATTTEIWRWFTEQPEGNLTLTSRMRKQRREVGARLEDLAEDGYVTKQEVERRGTTLPAYQRVR